MNTALNFVPSNFANGFARTARPAFVGNTTKAFRLVASQTREGGGMNIQHVAVTNSEEVSRRWIETGEVPQGDPRDLYGGTFTPEIAPIHIYGAVDHQAGAVAQPSPLASVA